MYYAILLDADREHILETLVQMDWMIGGQDGAANRLGLLRTTLIYKMRKPELKCFLILQISASHAMGVKEWNMPQAAIC